MTAPISRPDLAFFVAIFNRVAAADGLDAGIAAVLEADRCGHAPLQHTVLVDEALEAIVRNLEKRRGLETGTLRGPVKSRIACNARQELYAAMREMGFSYPEIGRYCGGRDHSTIIAGIAALREREAVLSQRRALAVDARRAA